MADASGERVFASREEAVQSVVRDAQATLRMPSETWLNLIEGAGLVQRVAITPPELPSTASPAMVRSFRYVIRNDDLYTFSNFLDLLKAAIGVAIGVKAIGTAAGYKAIFDGFHAFYGTFKTILARGHRLHEVELSVLIVLKDCGTASTEDLAEAINRKGVEISAPAIEKFLALYERRDGKGFTRRVPPDHWCLDGI
jgi:hypothetical protein